MQLRKKGFLLQYLAYCIAVAALVLSIAFPLLLQYTQPFSIPTAAYSEMIINQGHLLEATQIASITHAIQPFWSLQLVTEVYYPVPAILNSIFMLISAFPVHYSMFLPLTAIGNIIFFVLAKYIFSTLTKDKAISLFFAALFYLLLTVGTLANGTSARASLGISFIAFFIYIYLKFSNEYSKNHAITNFGFLILLLLLVITTGKLYYFATLDIIALLSLIIFYRFFAQKNFPRKTHWFEGAILLVTVYLFLASPLMIQQIQSSTASNFASNLFQSIGSMVSKIGINIPGVQPTLWNVNLVNYDTMTQIGNQILLITQYLSIFALIACFILYKNPKNYRLQVVWLFCLFIVFLTVGEFGYFTAGPISPLRILLWLGPILTLSLLIHFITDHKHNRTSFTKLTIFVAVLVICLFCVGVWGGLRVNTLYGTAAAKMFTYEQVEPISRFMLTYTNDESPLIFASDETYSGTVFFIASLHNRTDSIVAQALLADSITMDEAIKTGNPEKFISNLHYNRIDYLLIVHDGKPIYGDVWGYVVENPKNADLSGLPFSVIYDSEQATLYKLPLNLP